GRSTLGARLSQRAGAALPRRALNRSPAQIACGDAVVDQPLQEGLIGARTRAVRLRRSGREIKMLIEGTDPFATAKPDARLIKLLIRARRFNATLVDSDSVPFTALAKREGVSRSYFTRLVRLSYLAPDITQAILDGRQPRDLTADKLLAHSRLPLTCTISGPCSALPEPNPVSLSHPLIGTAVLESGPTEIFPPLGAMSTRHARLC